MGKEKIVGLLIGGHKLKIVEVENDYKAFKRALGIESPVAVRVFKNGVEQSTNIVDKETYERIKENDTN